MKVGGWCVANAVEAIVSAIPARLISTKLGQCSFCTNIRPSACVAEAEA
jgi:hypothetical protein